MFCWIFKWKISQYHDQGIPFRGLTVRHMAHCSRCRDFDRSLHALTGRLQQSVPDFLRCRNHELSEKVIADLTPAPVKAGTLKLRSRPFFAVAASLVIIVAGSLILLRLVSLKKSPPHPPFPVKSTTSISATAALKGIMTGMESPFDQELKRLGQHLKSAARSLADGLKLD